MYFWRCGASREASVEVVVVDYAPETISYQDLLDVFWDCHDPTRSPYGNNGEPDLERSVIFAADSVQKALAAAALEAVASSGRYDVFVTTTVETAGHFHRAEEGQQRYLEKKGEAVCSLKHTAADAAE